MTAPIGAPVRRTEDRRFLTGRGTYTDDINRPGQLYAVFVRSPHAHAELRGIDTAAAKRAPGVVAIYTAADLTAAGLGTLPCGWGVKFKDGTPMNEPPHPVLAQGHVRHVGDPVAVVIADTREHAAEAAETVDVDYRVAARRRSRSTPRSRRARRSSTTPPPATSATTGRSATRPRPTPPSPRPRT